MAEEKKPFYITTTLPYVNADPHVGFAMEFIRADVIARFKKLLGHDVFFNTGTDEHGQKLFDGAQEKGVAPQEFVDSFAEKFKDLKPLLGISEDVHFIRTTDEHHVRAAQEFWKICDQNGYIYKKEYKIKYCVGCELEKTESELVDGKCPIHPNRELEIREEENYFFKWSEFQEKLLTFYEENPSFVTPDFRYNEIKEFVKRGLEDFSISRLKEKMSWGVPVPGDDGHVMYVWFDALVNYISTLGWPDNGGNFEKFWVEGDTVQYAGKDNLRQQSAMWQAMLMAAHLPNTGNIVINGFITGDGGVKMSKSLGNVVNPYDVVEEYGTDALRYYLLREVSSYEDSPFTMELFKQAYNANLVNGIGNLTNRIMKLAEDNLEEPVSVEVNCFDSKFENALNNFDIKKATDFIWSKVSELDSFIENEKPFSVVKEDKEKGRKLIVEMVQNLAVIGYHLQPILPEAASKIREAIEANKKPETPLFERK